MKCSQTDCLSLEKCEPQGEAVSEKKGWKMITWKRQNFKKKKIQDSTEILQIWLEMEKYIFLFLS